MVTLYENIKQLCEQRGVTVSRMCLEIGVSKSTMSDLKSGKKKSMTIPTLEKMAVYLGSTVDEILHGTKKDLPLGLSSKPVEFDVDRLLANYDDWLTDSQRDLISLIYELPDDVVSMLLSAAKEWLKNHKSADSDE